jgi:hypothetical protein
LFNIERPTPKSYETCGRVKPLLIAMRTASRCHFMGEAGHKARTTAKSLTKRCEKSTVVHKCHAFQSELHGCPARCLERIIRQQAQRFTSISLKVGQFRVPLITLKYADVDQHELDIWSIKLDNCALPAWRAV